MSDARAHNRAAAVDASFADIGASLETIRQSLLAYGRSLYSVVDPTYREAVGQSVATLQGLTCRIAVIGQVKAGKSSFINALIGRPFLLPSDANPWTTVVTNLHFQNSPDMQEGARFTFFNADEWSRIAQGGGPLRELTERLVPGFDAALLGAQLDAMRRRAEQRLGNDFAGLLGQSHAYPAVRHDLLNRYVSAGPEHVDPGAGWYSDITKHADLFFGSPRAGMPVTLVDTPGTNDPLLVRDEITRLNVGTGDLFLVMLTAQQPMSAADISLLRLLRGLRKDRIVIFINRIDGLQDIAVHSSRVVAHVEERLREEFPGATPPVIVGSAHWATIAMAGADNDVVSAISQSFVDYAAARGLRITTAAEARAALMQLSGLPAVTSAIAHLAVRGSAAHTIRQHAQFLADLARATTETARGQQAAVERALTETFAKDGEREGQLRAWRQELDQLGAANRQLQENLAFYERSIGAIVDRCSQDLRKLLGECLGGYVQRELDDLAQSYRDRRSNVWNCDSTQLRKDLQYEFLKVYGYWESMLQSVDQQIMAQFQKLMPDFGSQASQPVPYEATGRYVQPPSISAFSQPLALDLAAPWWKAWWSGHPTLAEVTTRLEQVVRREFEPLIEDLVTSAVVTLRERSAQAVRQARMCTVDIVDGIHRRGGELVARLEQSGGPADAAARTRLDQERREAESRVAGWAELSARLSQLHAECNSVVGGAGT